MRAGFAKREITPNKSMQMAGFDRRTSPSTGMLDRLYVSVLAMEDSQEQRFLLCSYDLLGVDSQLCEQVREAMQNALGIDPSRVWISATHTHSGPTGFYYGRSSYDKEYVELLIEQAQESARAALADLQDAAPAISQTSAVGVASLRNQGRSGAAFPMPLRLTKLKRKEDVLSFCIFACHPTVLDEKNTLYSKDIPGAAAKQLPAEENCLFLNAACADLSTRFTRTASSIEELDRLGGIMGQAIVSAPYAQTPAFGQSIRTAQQDIFLSRSASLGGEERTALLSALREKMNACEDAQAKREYDSRIAVLERDSVAAEKDRRIHVAAVDFGPYLMLSLPFEVDSKDGNELECTLSGIAEKPVYLLCYTGGYDGYLPSGKPLSIESSYEDIASRYLPQSREQVWECAKQCVLQAKI